MTKDSMEFQTNPKYVTRMKKDKTLKRLERLEKRIERCEKLEKILEPVALTGMGLLATGGVTSVVGITERLSTMMKIGSISLAASGIAVAAVSVCGFATVYGNYLKSRNR